MSATTPEVEVLPPEPDIAQVDPFLVELSQWMDTRFEIPGLRLRFGLDALLGLIPGFGDFLTFLVTCYVLSAAARHGIPRITLARMGMNAIVDAVMGCVPLVGDLFDVAWKANTRNVALLQRTLESTPQSLRRYQRQDWLFVSGLILAVAIIIGLLVAATWMILVWLIGWGR
jgi:hypothetical protein